MPRDDQSPLRGVELHILLSVVDKPRHGYAILQEAEERTGGHPGFEIPTLYRALRRLRSEGLVDAAPRPSGDDDQRKEYWSATDRGRAALESELARIEVALQVGRNRLRHAAAGGQE